MYSLHDAYVDKSNRAGNTGYIAVLMPREGVALLLRPAAAREWGLQEVSREQCIRSNPPPTQERRCNVSVRLGTDGSAFATLPTLRRADVACQIGATPDAA
jgi:hypothetical protein